MPNWLSNDEAVNSILIIIALATLVFQIKGSEQSLKFAKKIYKTLGRVVIGTFAILIRIPILFFIQLMGSETILSYQELFRQFSLQSLIKSIYICNGFLLLLDVI